MMSDWILARIKNNVELFIMILFVCLQCFANARPRVFACALNACAMSN